MRSSSGKAIGGNLNKRLDFAHWHCNLYLFAVCSIGTSRSGRQGETHRRTVRRQGYSFLIFSLR